MLDQNLNVTLIDFGCATPYFNIKKNEKDGKS